MAKKQRRQVCIQMSTPCAPCYTCLRFSARCAARVPRRCRVNAVQRQPRPCVRASEVVVMLYARRSAKWVAFFALCYHSVQRAQACVILCREKGGSLSRRQKVVQRIA